MIKLAAIVQTTYFSNLIVPPTHAILCSRLMQNGVGSPHDVVGFTLNYWYGTLNATGSFVVNNSLGTVVIQIPNPAIVTLLGMPTITTLLANLFGVGVAPTSTTPLVALSVPTKRAGDHKIIDIDAIAAYVEPRLAGSPI